MRSFLMRRALPFLLVVLCLFTVIAPSAALAQTARPRFQGVGAQDRGVGDFLSGLWETATGDGPLSENARIASGALNETVEHPVDTFAQEVLNVPTGGSITDALTARLLGFIAFMMGLIVAFLGKIILLLVNILLGFLTYNGFADAPPVIIGWRMVRDLANMFFIIILILSSYSTILGWRSDLHVRSVLPKVLVAAVTVNFSRTIVALLIDFSQVVMLTFVNAFAAIGAGNFTNALHLPLIANTAASASSTASAAVVQGGSGQVILDVILASGFQIFLLVVAIGVMLMMVVFVVVRIVGLWMLLIFSPIPFLASALPDNLKKMLGKQVDGFWGRLSGFLTGGPIMAFWLWLTFATLSAQGADERLGLFNNTSATDPGSVFGIAQNGASMFITAIGNARGLGSYLVAIAMMLMGLEAAMGAADAIGGSAGKFMKDIGNRAKSYAQKAALIGAGGGIPAAALWAAGGAAGAVDRRYDLRGKAAGAARTVIPFAGQSKWLREQQYKNRTDQAKRASEYSAILNNPYATDAEKKAEMRRLGYRGFMTGDRAVDQARAEYYAKNGNNEKAYDSQLQGQKDRLKAAAGATTDSVVGKSVSDRVGKAESNQRRIADLERAKSLITGSTAKDKEERQKIDDAIKKIRKEDPHLINNNDEERAKQMKEVRQNWASLSQDAKNNFEVIQNVATAGAFTVDKGKVKLGSEAAINETRKRLSDKDLVNFNSVVDFVKESKGGVDVARMSKLSFEQDAQGRRRIVEHQTDAFGNVVGAKFRQSDEKEEAEQVVQQNFTTKTSSTWSPATDTSGINGTRGVATQDARDRLNQSAQKIGVAQTVNNVAYGASPAEAAPLREAAVSHFASTVHSEGRAAAGNLNKVEAVKKRDANGYVQRDPAGQVIYETDASGAAVTATPLQRYQDNRVSQVEKAEIRSNYQKSVEKIMPILEGVDQLEQRQQIRMTGAMGYDNVAQMLNVPESMMNESQRQTVNKVRKMVRDNSTKVDEWINSQDTTRMQRFGEADQLPEPQREAALKAHGLTMDQYREYRDYKGAQMAYTQFNKGGKGKSSGSRNRSNKKSGGGAGGGP